MGRRIPRQYHASANLQTSWYANDSKWMQSRLFGTEPEAIEQARAWVDEMRRDGARSPIRRVRVTQWEPRIPDPPILEASYYDPEQGLTPDEVYAARVHEWHALDDRMNYNRGCNQADYRVKYGPWQLEWGTKPKSCPHCQRTVDPQNLYFSVR